RVTALVVNRYRWKTCAACTKLPPNTIFQW
ncbi:beta-eliminating lyase family protein, partial [Vibrio parahaemolyticus 10296]